MGFENTPLNRPGFGKIKETLITPRSYEDYKNILLFTDDDVRKWRAIVDLGSGIEQEFAKDAKRINPDATIISVDPGLALSEEEDLGRIPDTQLQRRRLHGRKNPEKYSIAALSNNLPLRADSVDAILALYSVPGYLENDFDGEKAYDHIEGLLRQTDHVLAEGGMARFFPVAPAQKLMIERLATVVSSSTVRFIEKESGDQKNYLLLMTKHEKGA